MKTNKHLIKRPRRLRTFDSICRLVRETRLHIDDFIAPLFITSGSHTPVQSMPGIYHWPMNKINQEIDALLEVGIDKVLLFGLPHEKDDTGSDSYSDDGIIQKALRKIKKDYPDLFVITDVCFCAYTEHGHCGLIKDQDVDNDTTLELLGRQAVSHAKSGADMVAPSGMIDGMVYAIRTALDVAVYNQIPIMSYAIKYASSFYSPFREASKSTPQFGSRRTYQIDPANVREAIKEAKLDIEEGADIIMVKPALAYLDIVSEISQMTDLPVACYNVSGEYSMLKAASEKGWLDHDTVMLEMLLSMKRAGAHIIISYFAKDIGRILSK